MLDRLIGENIELKTQLESDLGIITADTGQIEQVIINLAINARDAMPAGGELLIETKKVFLDEAPEIAEADMERGRYVLLRVSDTGQGMNEDSKESTRRAGGFINPASKRGQILGDRFLRAAHFLPGTLRIVLSYLHLIR